MPEQASDPINRALCSPNGGTGALTTENERTSGEGGGAMTGPRCYFCNAGTGNEGVRRWVITSTGRWGSIGSNKVVRGGRHAARMRTFWVACSADLDASAVAFQRRLNTIATCAVGAPSGGARWIYRPRQDSCAQAPDREP